MILATNTNEEASEKLKKELEEHDVLSSRVGDDTNNDNAVDSNDTADAVTPSKQAKLYNQVPSLSLSRWRTLRVSVLCRL